MDQRAQVGRTGEKHARRFLRHQKYRIVTRNYRCPLGEIDLIALDGPVVVFVEVKTRTDREHGDPQDTVTAGKQRRIMRAAEFFLRQTGSEGRACRFDVVAVTLKRDAAADIEHLPDAFRP